MHLFAAKILDYFWDFFVFYLNYEKRIFSP